MSVKVNIYNQKGEIVGEKQLSDKIFNVKLSDALVHQAAVAQEANERQVLAHTKVKSEVRGGGKKPWRQKGTGRARAGSSRSPLWKGGGVTFGPRKDRNFKKDINKKMKQKAIFMALTDKVKNENFYILNEFKIDEYKTKLFLETLKNLEAKISGNDKKNKNIRRNMLFVISEKNEKLYNSGRNIKGVEIINLDNINILSLLKHKNLVVTENAINKIEERYK